MNINRVSSPQFSEVYPVITVDDGVMKKKLESFAQKDVARMALLKKSLNGKGIFHYHGTLFPCVFKLIHFWIGLATFVGVIIAVKSGEDIPTIDDGTVSSLKFFMAFFLVFYVNQNYNRHTVMYNFCMTCEGRIFDAAGMMYGFSRKEHLAEVHTFIRYLNAAHVLAYLGMNDTYERDNFLVPYNDKYGVLEPDELRYLDQRHDLSKNSSSSYREVISWSISYVKHLCDKNVLTEFEMMKLVNQVNQLRASLASLFDIYDQPIPFIYIHMINVLLLVLMPILGYHSATLVTQNSTVSEILFYLLSYLFYSGFYCGLKVAGLRLSDPIGHDLCDYPILEFLTFTLRESMKILDSAKEEIWIPDQLRKIAKRTRPSIEGERMKFHGFNGSSKGCSENDKSPVTERSPGIMREISTRGISTITEITNVADDILS